MNFDTFTLTWTMTEISFVAAYGTIFSRSKYVNQLKQMTHDSGHARNLFTRLKYYSEFPLKSLKSSKKILL